VNKIIALFLVFLVHEKGLTQRLSWAQWDKIISQKGETILSDTIAQHRQEAVDFVMDFFNEHLNDPTSFQEKFIDSKFLSILYPEDSSFRIITGQLFIDNNSYRYYGGIQKSNGVFIPFTDRSYENEEEGLTNEELRAEEWQGALYYRLFDCKLKGKPYYLLLGFNGYSFFNKRKTIEILSFDANDQPLFGKDVFIKDSTDGADIPLRYIFTYSADVSMQLNYEKEEDLLILDHLIPMSEIYKGQGETAVPDGTYEAFQYKKGRWKHISFLPQRFMNKSEMNSIPKNKTKQFGRTEE
jgi:hypothetical protein